MLEYLRKNEYNIGYSGEYIRREEEVEKMALIKCPECGKEISDKAGKCPNCGEKMDKSKKICEGNNSSEKNDKHKLIIVIIILIAIIISLLFILIAKQDSEKENGSIVISENINTREKKETGEESQKKEKVFAVNKMLYDDEYISITCESISQAGINFKVTSKLKNRNCSISVDKISLDGLGVDLYNYYHCEIQPGESINYTMEGSLNYLEHKLLSLTGDVYDDTGTGFVELDICDFDLGGEANLEYDEKIGLDQFSSDNIDVKYIGASGKGLEFRVYNKKQSMINIVCDSLKLNEEELELYFGCVSVPANSTVSYYVDVISGNPDLLPEDIKAFTGVMHTWGRTGNTEDKFSISFKK